MVSKNKVNTWWWIGSWVWDKLLQTMNCCLRLSICAFMRCNIFWLPWFRSSIKIAQYNSERRSELFNMIQRFIKTTQKFIKSTNRLIWWSICDIVFLILEWISQITHCAIKELPITFKVKFFKKYRQTPPLFTLSGWSARI